MINKYKKIIFSVLLIIFTSQIVFSQSTISIRLGPGTGQDCGIMSFAPYTAFPAYPEIICAAWTYGGEFNLWRPLVRFNLTEIPQGVNITNARLSLYGNPFPVSSPHYGQNKCYIRKITSPWDQNTVTWDTQPDFSTEFQVSLSESTSSVEDYPDLDVTDMIREMYMNPSQNYGFTIMLRTEYYYRCLNFASSDCTDISKRPKLDITYSDGIIGTEPLSSVIPIAYKLYQNYPNPFNPVTSIRFDIPENSNVILKVYDQLGSEVSVLVNENLSAGSYQVKWDGSTKGSGTYYARLQTGNTVLTNRMVLLK